MMQIGLTPSCREAENWNTSLPNETIKKVQDKTEYCIHEHISSTELNQNKSYLAEKDCKQVLFRAERNEISAKFEDKKAAKQVSALQVKAYDGLSTISDRVNANTNNGSCISSGRFSDPPMGWGEEKD